MSVKGGCIDGLDWKKAIHLWTKSAMVPIPEGSESFEEEPDSTDYGSDKDNRLEHAGELAGSGSCHEHEEAKSEPKTTITGACELSGVNMLQGVL